MILLAKLNLTLPSRYAVAAFLERAFKFPSPERTGPPLDLYD
jgi:hypothetical protein